MNKLFYIIIFFFIIYFFFINFKESFFPIENTSRYDFINNFYCLMTKNITSSGGEYKVDIGLGNPSKLENNQAIKFIDDDFTKEDCINKRFGSGRRRGGFECIDFITKKMANKYQLEYSDKTCVDSLPYKPDYPQY